MCQVPQLSLAVKQAYDKPEFTPPEAQGYGSPRPPRTRRRGSRMSLAVPFVVLSAGTYWAHRTGKLKGLKLPLISGL